jgi:peptidoglycan lytic transglycosylase
MHMLVLSLLVSLLAAWPTTAATGQPPRGQREAPDAQVPALTEDQVKQAQEALKTEGFHPGSIDGVVGRRTREALRAYQAREGLPATGVLDQATFSRLAPRPTCVQEGLATSYGHAWEGRRTAGGDRLDPDALTAGHRTLPFGTSVRVTNLETNQSVEVTINDRGPKTKQHLIDLTPAAAEQIGWRERRGESPVRVEVLDPKACEAGGQKERG